MGKELYLECGRGLNCDVLAEVLTKLLPSADAMKSRMEEFDKYGAQTVAFFDAEMIFEESCLQKDIKEKLIQTLRLIQENGREESLPFSGAENCVRNLAVLGVAAELLDVSEIIISTVREGIKEPDPRVLQVLAKCNIPVEFAEDKGEMLTVNSACFLGVFGKAKKLSQKYYIEKTAFDKKNSGIYGMLLETDKEEEPLKEKRDVVQVLETNVDDCSGEQLGYAIECLMKAGALDASCFPVYMKKLRPAYMLQVICRKEKQELLEDIIFRETTSIGLRRYEEKRRILPRSFQEVRLKDGHMVKIKVCEHHGQRYYYPEYETIKKVCEETGRPYRNVYDEAAALAGGFYDII